MGTASSGIVRSSASCRYVQQCRYFRLALTGTIEYTGTIPVLDTQHAVGIVMSFTINSPVGHYKHQILSFLEITNPTLLPLQPLSNSSSKWFLSFYEVI